MNKMSLGMVSAVAMMAMIGTAGAAEVNGFRSAKFGANEKTVMESAAKDLNVKASDIVKVEDPTLKITTLTATVAKFAPLDLPAKVTYVMGYKCSCLTQVSVLWNLPENVGAEQRKNVLIGVSALAGKFQNMGWEKDEVVVNRVPGEVKENSENVLVLFHGQNKKKSAITLAAGPVRMQKPTEKDAKADKLSANIDEIKSVSVSYEKDATNPDVFQVDVSGF